MRVLYVLDHSLPLHSDGKSGFLFPAGDAQALARRIGGVLACRGDWPCIRERARRLVDSARTWARSVARYSTVDAARVHGSVPTEV